MRTFKIPIEIYKSNLHVWLSTPEQADKKFKSTLYAEYGETTFHDFGGKTLMADDIEPIIWIDARSDKNTAIENFTHELVHVMNGLMDYRGNILQPGNDDSYAYLAGYLMKKFLQKL